MIKYEIKYSNKFKKELKKCLKQGKNIDKLLKIVEYLSCGIKLEDKYRDHNLINNKFYNNCRECHVEPDWLLIYKYDNNNLILFLIEVGSHSDLFKN